MVTINPNPIIDEVTVNYTVSSDCKVSIKLLDSYGRILIDILPDQITLSGEYMVKLNLHSFSNGIYFISMKSANNSITKKIIKL